MEQPQAPKETLVLDTCLLLAAISQGRQDPNNNSPLDRAFRQRNIDPEKIRGGILQALTNHDIIIPAIVYQELEAQTEKPNLSETNQKNLRSLLDTIQNYTTPQVASRTEVFAQKNGLEALQTAAQIKVQNYITQYCANPTHIPKRWENIDPHTPTHNTEDPQQASLHQFKQFLKRTPACLTWMKLKDYLPQVQKNVETLLQKPHIVKTEQITLLDEAEILHRELELEEQEEIKKTTPLNPRIEKILQDFLESIPENQKEGYSQFEPKHFSKLPKHIQATQLECLADYLKPKLIPDVEIALVSKNKKAKILTLDQDFTILQTYIPTLKTLPPPENKLQGPDQSLKDFLRELKKNLSKKSSTTQKDPLQHQML